jgi:1-acyl-sn-glycerol-3-phosphate acyltransferase
LAASYLALMQEIIFERPYVPVPPYHGRLWPKILIPLAKHILQRSYGIISTDVKHTERLRESLAGGHAVLLAVNHSRDQDPLVLYKLSLAVNRPFFLMASWHVFEQGRLRGYLLRRAGGFSIYREGVDRGAVNTAVEILEKGQRPLVIFPEGIVSRTNQHINPLMEGVSLIARSAARKRAKHNPPGKLIVHPVAIRYHFRGDINAAVSKVLDEIEQRISWQPQRHLPQLERIYKLGGALLSLKEIEYLGAPQAGELTPRLERLMDAILTPLEQQWLKEVGTDSVPARVKRLRAAILPDMIAGKLEAAERQRRWKHLADVYLAQQLNHYPQDYLKSNPNADRLLETIERFEEDLTDVIRVHGPTETTVTVGTAIEVSPTRESRGGDDPLLTEIDSQLRQMLEIKQ